MITQVMHADHPQAVLHARDVLRNGGLVAFPTDTVYGLAALAFEAAFVDRLYVAKGRSHDKAIAILLGESGQLSQVAREPVAWAQKLARAFWPGPLTLILPRHPDVPEAVSSQPTIGVRVPDHPVARKLLTLAGPLAVTSANLAGRPSPKTAAAVLEQMEGRAHLVLDGGETPGGVPSSVVDCTGTEPVMLRAGPVTMEAIREALRGQA